MRGLLRKIKIRAKERGYKPLIKLSVKLNWPKLTAWFFALLSKPSANSGKYTILVLGRSVFYDDIAAMMKFSGKLQYRSIHLDYWQKIFDCFFDAQDCAGLFELNYHRPHFCQKTKERYRDYLQAMFPYLQKFMPFDAVFTGNISYVVQQELSAVCETARVPFIVLHKEAVVLPEDYDKFVNIYKGCQFFGAKVLFYNKMCRDGFLNLRLPGLTADKTALVGVPRLDYCFEKKDMSAKKQIVVFSFLPRYSLRFMELKEEILQKIEGRTVNFFKAFMEFAKNHPDFQVIIKTKQARHYLDYPQKISEEHFRDQFPNLLITNSGDPSELIAQSVIVAGFNSTTLIEAIVSGKPILSPNFDDFIPDRQWSFFGHYPKLVHKITTLQDLETVLKKAGDFAYDESEKKAFLNEYISTTTGGASQRAELEIIKTLESYRQVS